jgi:hypothetical protein
MKYLLRKTLFLVDDIVNITMNKENIGNHVVIRFEIRYPKGKEVLVFLWELSTEEKEILYLNPFV